MRRVAAVWGLGCAVLLGGVGCGTSDGSATGDADAAVADSGGGDASGDVGSDTPGADVDEDAAPDAATDADATVEPDADATVEPDADATIEPDVDADADTDADVGFDADTGGVPDADLCSLDCPCDAVCEDGVVTIFGGGEGWEGPCGDEPECPGPVEMLCANGCADVAPDDTCRAAREALGTGEPTSLCAPPALPACDDGPGNGEILRDIAWGDDDERQILDLYLPAEMAEPGPLFVWIHGGGWRGGSHSSVPPDIRRLVARGITVASISYRLSDTSFPTTISDTRAAVRWLEGQADTYGYDGTRIGVGGSSAGGHLAAMLGVASDVEGLDLDEDLAGPEVGLVIDFFGPSELLAMDDDAVANGCPDGALCHDCVGSPEGLLVDCEGELSTCAETATLASPLTHVTSRDAPFVILHGDEDCTVPTPQGPRLHDALVAAGVESTLIVTEGAGHNTGAVGTDEAWDVIFAAVDTHLLGCERPEPEPTDLEALFGACMADACEDEATACADMPGCAEVEACIVDCFGTMGCVAGCIDGVDRDVLLVHRPMYDCGIDARCY